MERARGFGVAEIAALVVLVVIAGAVIVILAPELVETEKSAERRKVFRHEAAKVECMNNVRNLTNLLNIMLPNRYPDRSGANLVLYLVEKGEIREGRLELLFCPGDGQESLAAAGDPDAYREIDLDRNGVHGHLTSYAGRDLSDHPARPGQAMSVVLVADDSPDHHDGKGIVVGMSDGSVQWREFLGDYGVDSVTIGPDSEIEELACLRAD